ncbi:MAG: methylated-DNA--[protein]-cysteine S-methyltransferase [Lachnospiraceae bacterium]
MADMSHYDSPVGRIFLASRNDALIGLWLEGQKYFLGSLKEEMSQKDDSPILLQTKDWLDRYFAGKKPEISQLNMAPEGSTFRQEVWKLLCQIPYGQVTTYKEIAAKAAEKMGRPHMSAQAVGGAVGHNPISIIIPCHRVVGTDRSLTGYAGGIDKKIWLLTHEGVNVEEERVLL